MEKEIISIETLQKIQKLEKQKELVLKIVDNLDDRNSLKLQLLKKEVKKIYEVE